ncbi:hypothetical protein FFY45_22435 [Xanthomonas hortorum]|nr:hypothetical protein [Xanthomonas hortorum]
MPQHPKAQRNLVLATKRTDHLDWPLPAHRRGTLRGMDAAWTYLRRVPRWWAGKGPAAKPQTIRSGRSSASKCASPLPKTA